MYKLQSEGGFANRFRLGYDDGMGLKPDYQHRHFSLIDDLAMNELNNSKMFDYVKSYAERPAVATSYRTVRKDVPAEVPAEKAEVEQRTKEPAKSRKRKRHRKRNRRNRNRKNKSQGDEDPGPSLAAQFCAISIEAPDEVDGCFSVRPNSFCRTRLPSDCDSEDSFIVFGNENVAAPFYPECKPRLFSECISEDSFIVFDGDSECEDSVVFDSSQADSDELPAKKVRFASEENLCEIHPMIQWSYAYQKARKGPWEQFALDRMRFRNRVANVKPILDRILEPSHRSKIYEDRFGGDPN